MKIIYWTSTILISLFLTWSSYTYIFNKATISGIRELGFPDYFRIQLSILKVIAVILLLLPQIPIQYKEWAYSGKQSIKMGKTQIHGTVAKGFENVKKAYESNFYRDDIYKELGSSLCVYHKGEQVINLWAGYKDKEKTQAWNKDTMIALYSATKGIGLREFTLLDELMNWDLICDRLARQAPYWKPGEFTSYHGWTVGFLAGEIIRRVSGKKIGDFLQTEIAKPLHAEIFIGLPKNKQDNVATLYKPLSQHQLPDLITLPDFLASAVGKLSFI